MMRRADDACSCLARKSGIWRFLTAGSGYVVQMLHELFFVVIGGDTVGNAGKALSADGTVLRLKIGLMFRDA